MGLEQAIRYPDELIAGFEKFAEHPRLGQGIDHIRKGYRRAWVERHVIYYKTRKFGIAVIRILHNRMLPIRHLPESKTD
jgi:toxin ParE1/3/4